MRKPFALVLLLLLSWQFIYAQRLSAIDTSKYRINLPAYWKKGNKIWTVLNDKLPMVCEELKNKELCGDHCNPKYIIAFEMTQPVVSDRYLKLIVDADSSESWKSVAGNNFSFRASLLLLNNQGELLTRFIIVDSNEVWPLYDKNPGTPRPQVVTQQVADPALTTATANVGATSIDPLPVYNDRTYVIYKYDEAGKRTRGPSEADLFTIVDKKIRKWE